MCAAGALRRLRLPSISATSSTNSAGTTMRSSLSSTSILSSSVVARAHFAVASEVSPGIITHVRIGSVHFSLYYWNAESRFSSELACILRPNQFMLRSTFGVLLSCLGLKGSMTSAIPLKRDFLNFLTMVASWH